MTAIAKINVTTFQDDKLGAFRARVKIQTQDIAYSIETEAMRNNHMSAIQDGMDEAQQLADRNEMLFIPTHTNAGEIHDPTI
jgi:hypothetical protein